jgi:DNA-binding NarL/FixJ family response regulator
MRKAPSRLIAVTEREFIRGCLLHWLHACCPEFEAGVVADLSEIHLEELARPPAAIVIDASSCHRSLDWITQQIETKRRHFGSTPTILIVDGLDADLVQDLVSRQAVDGFIPTSDTTEVAAAALRLVIAGGHYGPQLTASAAPSPQGPADPLQHESDTIQGLTLRERTVLELLRTGEPNKLIAYKLGMSLSTAKVHVHNIIRKLKVRNRTEAVIAAGKLGAKSSDQSLHAAARAGHLDLDLAAIQDGVEIGPHLANHPAGHPRGVGAKARRSRNGRALAGVLAPVR